MKQRTTREQNFWKKHTVWGALLLWCAGALVACAQPPLAFPLQARRILFLGDSITHNGQYVAWIELQLRLQGANPMPEVICLGLSSETCSGLSEPDHPFPRPNVHDRLARALKLIRPDVVVACYGMNDGIYHPFSPERFAAFQQGVRRLVNRAHQAGARVVLLTPVPFDPLPLTQRPGKLAQQGPFGYKRIYARYDQVIRRYAQWILQGEHEADLVVDVHTPLVEYVQQQRRKEPRFTLSPDGIHPNALGHRLMAQAVLRAWGVESWMEPPEPLWQLALRRMRLLHAAYLSAVGHNRPGIRPGLPLEQAQAQAKRLLEQIQAQVVPLRKPQLTKRPSYEGTLYQIHYPPTVAPGQLRLAVDYYVWIPSGVKTLRGVIVHQHGCGPGASLAGRTAAEDLHWQALARRWECALLGSSYEPRRGISCRLWCDPRQGSAERFLQALQDVAQASAHPELSQVPWCLWGHSGGAFWASLMQCLYPQRVVAVWFRSGTGYLAWTRGQIPAPKITPEVLKVPMAANPGAKEKDHPRFRGAWQGLWAMRQEYLRRGAKFFLWAPDPHTGHECGRCRYLAIPFFHFWLARRLPPAGQYEPLPVSKKHLDQWKQQMEHQVKHYLENGTVPDQTPPPDPFDVIAEIEKGKITVRWRAQADLESGLKEFIIYRNGTPVARIPQEHRSRFGQGEFQGLSYHDTPVAPWPKMEYQENLSPGKSVPHFAVQAVNTAGLKSSVVKAKVVEKSK